MADQTPDIIDVSLHRAITVAVGGMLGCGPEPEIASVALETIEAAGFRVVPIVDADAIRDRLTSTPLGWIRDKHGDIRPASESHSEHIYSGDCAVCRCGDRTEALDVVINAVLAAAPPIVDAATRQEVEALIEAQAPHACVHCKGTGWIDDDGWSYYGDGWSPGSKPRERVERDGLVPCGMCGDWHVYRDERTEPTMVVDGWSSEQESRAAELLAAAYLGRTD